MLFLLPNPPPLEITCWEQARLQSEADGPESEHHSILWKEPMRPSSPTPMFNAGIQTKANLTDGCLIFLLNASSVGALITSRGHWFHCHTALTMDEPTSFILSSSYLSRKVQTKNHAGLEKPNPFVPKCMRSELRVGHCLRSTDCP